MSHLPVLVAMYPGKVFLTVEDIARLLNLSKGHIYNLSSAKRLPFKLDDHSDKIQVSIVAMAKYLDSKIEEPKVKEENSPVPDLIKKRGRPRGASRVQMAFQAQLSLATLKFEVATVFGELRAEVEEFALAEDERPCSEKFDAAKRDFGNALAKANKSLDVSFLEIQLPRKRAAQLVVKV